MAIFLSSFLLLRFQEILGCPISTMSPLGKLYFTWFSLNSQITSVLVRCFKIYRIHGQLQRILGNTVFIQGGFVSREKIRGSNTM